MTSLRELERRKLATSLKKNRPRYISSLKEWGYKVKDSWSDKKVFDVYWDASVEQKRPEAELRAKKLGIPTRIFGFKRNVTDIFWDCMQEERRRELEKIYG